MPPAETFTNVTLPHCVTKLSWQKWDPEDWQDVWIYRRHFTLPKESRDRRVFVNFGAIMVAATPIINGHRLPQHLGGYLPCRYEITDWVKEADNVLEVIVDSRWCNVPPQAVDTIPYNVDYLMPGGIIRSADLQVLPPVYIADVFAKPVDVLSSSRRVDVQCSIDAAGGISGPAVLEVEMRDGEKVVTSSRKNVRIEKSGKTEASLILTNLGDVKLWEPDSPKLYNIVARLIVDKEPVHDYRTRIGLRDAKFTVDGFFLNGKRLVLFGLNRHELYPYVGYAMPSRVMRRDAEILKYELNCNAVRCSHYPQTEAFMDACDELGLLVWEEIPGWGHVSDDAAWREFVVRDVKEMILRDRNHPSVVIWGVRVNESKKIPELYQRTKAMAKSLDDSRPTSGSMTSRSMENWDQDIYAYDEYHADRNHNVNVSDPLPGIPYMLAEVVGQFSYGVGKGFDNKYRRAGDIALQQSQAIYHAQAHDRVAGKKRMIGATAWCAFDYGSVHKGYDNVKCPGVVDVFRIPKLGASFYLTQGDPHLRPVIIPNFYWDFGSQTPKGPGKNAAIFSNCDRLEVSIGGKKHATLYPDSKQFPNLKHPPFFTDLELDGTGKPELRIDGYVGNKLALSKSYSSDAAQDRFWMQGDDSELIADGSDATRVAFHVGDKFGENRLMAGGEVTFKVDGPAVLVGDNPFRLEPSGGVGAVWVRTLVGRTGKITVKATHSSLGSKTVEIKVKPDRPTRRI